METNEFSTNGHSAPKNESPERNFKLAPDYDEGAPKIEVPDWLRWTAKDEARERESIVDSAIATIDVATEATLALVAARRKLLTATLDLNDAKARFEDAKRDAYLMGTIVGKNAEEREARLASLLEVQTHNVRAAERAWLTAKVDVECTTDTLAGIDRVDRQMAVIESVLKA